MKEEKKPTRPGRTVGFYMSPAAQGYLAWATKWLKSSQGKAIEEALRCFVEQRMLNGAVHTTWNAVARALRNLPGWWDGFEEQEEDVSVVLEALQSPVTEQFIPGWLEVLIRGRSGFDSVQTLPDGRGTVIKDWLPPELHPMAPDREGIAVPVEVLGYISPA
jgi:hypothetical protein